MLPMAMLVTASEFVAASVLVICSVFAARAGRIMLWTFVTVLVFVMLSASVATSRLGVGVRRSRHLESPTGVVSGNFVSIDISNSLCGGCVLLIEPKC